jgi:hypothetical protein
MKKPNCICALVLALLTSLGVSCSSTRTQSATSKHLRFYEGASANVVLHFYEWNSIYITRPDIRKDKFLSLLDRDEIAHVLSRPDIGRDVAVVILSHFYSPAQELSLIQEWHSFLSEKGFRRIVLLQAGDKNKLDRIDGLKILHDSALTGALGRAGDGSNVAFMVTQNQPSH